MKTRNVVLSNFNSPNTGLTGLESNFSVHWRLRINAGQRERFIEIGPGAVLPQKACFEL